jgi:hypothetical protein
MMYYFNTTSLNLILIILVVLFKMSRYVSMVLYPLPQLQYRSTEYHRIPRIIRSFSPDFLIFMFFGMLINPGQSKIIGIRLSLSSATCPYAWPPVLPASCRVMVFSHRTHISSLSHTRQNTEKTWFESF